MSLPSQISLLLIQRTQLALPDGYGCLPWCRAN
uniref:Uncharacterized protein n=1 Tax=Anguilla anguilla TaxID=7936 RepID=A0A0E9XWW8_ANGAN